MENTLPRYAQEERVDMRFRPPEEVKTFRVSNMWEIHHEIARRLSLGESNASIAEALSVSPAMVSYTKNSKPIKDKVDIMRGAMDADTVDLGIRIQQIAPKALTLLEDIIDGKHTEASVALRARVADKHLDRAGYSPVKKLAVATQHLTAEDIEAIKERSRKSAIAAGVIDAEVISEN